LELRDLIVTPLVIIVVLVIAYIVRPYATDVNTRKYFFPALILKIIGAISLGVVYQFYYTGGDTFNYHTHGSRIFWEALCDDFFTGLKLYFSNGEFVPGTYRYINLVPFIHDAPSLVIIRIATFFDLFTYSSYSATAILFSVISFAGAWALFLTFYQKIPRLHFLLALACLFIPSVIFWGSGLLKDTIVLAALGFLTFCIDRIFIRHRFTVLTVITLAVSLIAIYTIRKFVLISFIPSAILWIFFKKFQHLKSMMLKIILSPLIILIFILTSYYSVLRVGEGDKKYSIDKLAETAQITAYDIGFYTGANAGSQYVLGNLDGSFSTMLKLAPQAINVSLFRPFLWEVKNPLMLLSALEGLFFLAATIFTVFKIRFRLAHLFSNPNILFCMVFSISYAFAVGVSTFNFGTLVRYKIPLLPFYLISLILLANNHSDGIKAAADS
jgi:hypothetical protein